MTNIMAEAVEAIEKKLDGSVFDGSAKFAIQDEGSIIITILQVFGFLTMRQKLLCQRA